MGHKSGFSTEVAYLRGFKKAGNFLCVYFNLNYKIYSSTNFSSWTGACPTAAFRRACPTDSFRRGVPEE
jgi:hypothetical protein